ncbi:MAG: CesT family type III secretion system chaperone, partial [Pseudomonadota bacterium]
MDPRNHLTQLVAELAARVDLELEFDAEGYAAIETADGVRVLLQAGFETDTMRLNTLLGEAPTVEREAFLSDMLVLNAQPELFGRAYFALNQTHTHVMLVMREILTDLDVQRLGTMLRMLVTATTALQPAFDAAKQPGKNLIDEFKTAVTGITST